MFLVLRSGDGMKYTGEIVGWILDSMILIDSVYYDGSLAQRYNIARPPDTYIRYAVKVSRCHLTSAYVLIFCSRYVYGGHRKYSRLHDWKDLTCIQFLAYVVAEGEGSLVKAAIETLSLIAQAIECRQSLANTFGVLESLQAVTEDEECYSDELRDEAAALFTSLQYARYMKKPRSPQTPTASSQPEQEIKKTDSVDSAPKKNPNDESSSVNASQMNKGCLEKPPHRTDSVESKSSEGSPKKTEDTEGSPKKADSARSSIGSRSLSTDEELSRLEKKMRQPTEMKGGFLGPNNSKAKIVTLFIKGMVAPEHRKQVEEELVRVRGLISIVFDLGRSRVTCRVKRDLSVDKLAAAVARTESLSAQQVTTNANGEEVFTLIFMQGNVK
ncbi:uncharacterized protein LOC119578443 [Penaeus monodon]|uniref:uncharacterized protein LOC119578443 n=1 Tax=Penaeus monodon TaxID=6687 RepID=UPI0018A7AB7F|nr:uncharacterized protein LOC119578443 [Penaeus monodon]